MNESPSFRRRCARALGGCVVSFAVWTLWLALGLLLAFQIYVATRSELTVPPALLARLERRIAETGFRAEFGATTFDPTGRVLIENVRVYVAGYVEPVLHARAVFVRLNPWLLAIGRAEPLEIRVNDATASVPAMLSSTGAPVALVHHVEATLFPGDRRWEVEQFNARFGNLLVTARGTLPLRSVGTPARPLPQIVQEHFPTVCRQALAAARWLEQVQNPVLDVQLTPGESGSPAADLTLRADRLTLVQPVAAQAERLRFSTRLILLDTPSVSQAAFSIGDLRLPAEVSVRDLSGNVYGRLTNALRFEPRSVELSLGQVVAQGLTVRALAAELLPRPLPRIDAAVTALVQNEPLQLDGKVDHLARTAELRVAGAVSPSILDVIGDRLKVNLRRHVGFESFEVARGDVTLGAGWRFENVVADVAMRRVDVRGVTLDTARGRIEFDGERLFAPNAFATIGRNFARGSYEQHVSTREFRFLLDGELRPMDISGWFREWWPNFFRQFEFPIAPPVASVDVRGIWREGPRTSVFVAADARGPAIRGASFDRVRTKLFVRPGFFDGLALDGTQGSGAVRGTFTFINEPGAAGWRSFEVAAESTLPLDTARAIGGPFAVKLLAPYALAAPAEVRVRGKFEGPGSPRGRHQQARIEAQTVGAFRFFHFPLEDVAFTALLDDNDLTLEKFTSRFAGGTATGHARIDGIGGKRQLTFDANIKDAALGRVAAALEEFFARRESRTETPPGKFVQEKANVKLDLAATGVGDYANPFSFQGSGHTVLQGAEIGEVPLLGALSELFTFTALKFTSARSTFRIEGPRLVFPEVEIRGSGSAIDAHGVYALDRRLLDFKAKVFPFQDSSNVLKTVVGAVLSPFANALEVKLTGNLQKPQWSFVLGPTNFLRSLAVDPEREPTPKPPAPNATPANPPAVQSEAATVALPPVVPAPQ